MPKEFALAFSVAAVLWGGFCLFGVTRKIIPVALRPFFQAFYTPRKWQDPGTGERGMVFVAGLLFILIGAGIVFRAIVFPVS